MNHFIDTNEWMDKRLIFPPINDRGEQVVNWITSEDSGLIKTAAAKKTTYHKRIQDYIEKVKPRKDMACCVISALGSYETWGQNINGDRFPRVMFLEGQHKTYEKVGYPFKHHLNKPDRGHPIYGDRVTLAEFNERMDRVELIVWYDLTKDTSLLNDIESGNVGVSMGMKTPYDMCTITGCGNKAKTQNEYCIHANRETSAAHGYRMGMILPDGQQIGRWNRYAKFFDISRVLIPAWQPGRILEKVASSGQKFWNISPEYMVPSAYLAKSAEAEKQAQLDKNADMYKTVPSLEQQKSEKAVEFMNMAKGIQSCEPELPSGVLNNMAERHPLKKIISTMLGLGVVPKPKEFQRIVLVKVGKKDLADEFEKQGHIFTDYPASEPKDETLIDVDYNFCSEKVAMVLEPYLKDRSCLRPFLYERLEKIAAQNYLLPQQPLIGQKREKRNLGKEAVKTMAGIGGLYALMRGAITGKPMTAGGKPLIPNLADIPGGHLAGSKVDKTFEKMFGTNPVVKMILLAALGSGAIAAAQKMSEPSILTNYDQPLDTPPLVRYNEDYLNTLKDRNAVPLVKLGAWDPQKIVSTFKGPMARTAGKTLKRAAIGLPAFYMLAGAFEAKRRRDPFAAHSEGSVKKFFREHPGLAATAFTFHPQAIDVAKGFLKKASVGDDVRDWAIFGAMDRMNPTLGITSGVADALLLNAATKAFKAVRRKFKKKNTNINQMHYGR